KTGTPPPPPPAPATPTVPSPCVSHPTARAGRPSSGSLPRWRTDGSDGFQSLKNPPKTPAEYLESPKQQRLRKVRDTIIRPDGELSSLGKELRKSRTVMVFMRTKYVHVHAR